MLNVTLNLFFQEKVKGLGWDPFCDMRVKVLELKVLECLPSAELYLTPAPFH